MKRKILGLMMIVTLFCVYEGVAKGPQNVMYTKHNLANWNSATVIPDIKFKSTNVNEVCVFCHTPHGSAGYPLWNKELTTRNGSYIGNAFYAYTTNYTKKPTVLGNETLLCMSCHDGVSSMGYLANAPNSLGGGNILFGSGTPDDGNQLGDAAGVAWGDIGNAYIYSQQVWASPLPDSNTYYNSWGAYMIFDTGDRVAKINPSMAGFAGQATGDHPISINYAEVAGKVPSQFADPALVRQKLPLFGINRDIMECATCHDVHVNTASAYGGDADYKPFLTMRNHSSAMCFTCHIK